MRIKCRRDGLLSAFQFATGAVAGRDQKPVLQNVKVSANAGMDRFTLQSTNLEVGIRLECNSTIVEEPGDALIPAAKMLTIIRESPDEDLTVETRNSTCNVRGQSSEFELCSEDPTHFPDVPTFSADKYHEIQAGTLRELIRRTLFAVATESPRYALTGILWELEGSTIRLVATDCRGLAVAEGPAKAQSDHNPKGTHVVPTKAMQPLERNLHGPDDEQIRVSLRSNEALFQIGQTMIHTRLVEGRFPAYKDILPKKAAIKVSLVTGPFHAAIRQAAVMAEDETKKVDFNFEPKKLVLRAENAEAGRSQVELPIEYAGKPLEIAFHPKLLTDMLRALDPMSDLTLALMDSKSPALFRCGDNYSYLAMPLN